MKVLQLCLRIPYPANDGGNIAMLGIAESLVSQGVQVKMLALNTRKHWGKPESLPDKFKTKFYLESVPIDTSIKATDAFFNLFSSESYNLKRFYSKVFETRLTEILSKETFDVILFESLYMSTYITAARKISKAKIVLRTHNVEHVIWERLAANENNILKKNYLSLLAKRLRNYEIQVLGSIDAMLPITDEDKNFSIRHSPLLPIETIPVGVDLNKYANQLDETIPLCFFHIGSMDWLPNIEGIKWFLNEVWNQIHVKFPSLKLFLAGRNFPASISDRKDKGVINEGEVKDAHAFMKGKQIMVVPLKSGGGMRVKIIEGMALGKTIISTSIGAEGIAYTNNKNILIANTPEEFLSAVEKCFADNKFCFSIGAEARKLAVEKYSNEMIGRRLINFLQKV